MCKNRWCQKKKISGGSSACLSAFKRKAFCFLPGSTGLANKNQELPPKPPTLQEKLKNKKCAKTGGVRKKIKKIKKKKKEKLTQWALQT